MRISEWFRFSPWSAGVVSVIISGHLAVSGVQAQSVAQIKSGPPQSGPGAQADTFIRDAETALSKGDKQKADQYLRVAEAMLQQSGGSAGEILQKTARLREQLGASAAGGGREASDPVGLLLSARQAIARGDTAAADGFLKSARASGADFRNLNDNPDAVAKLVERQNALVKLASSGDAGAFNEQAARFLIEQAGDLLARGDHQTTILLVEQAKRFPVDLSKEAVSPDSLLTQARSLATAAAKAPASGSAVADARRLTSMAMLAVDRKDWAEARRLVDEAMGLKVPDSEFGADETRPWQLDLVVRKQGGTTVDPQVQSASVNAMEQPGSVRQADYDPASDRTRNIQVGLQTEPGATPDPAMAQGGSGAEELNLTAPLDAETKLFRELQSMVFRERAVAERMMTDAPRTGLDKMVALRGQIATSALTQENRNPLLAMIDRDIREMQRYIEGNLPDIVVGENNAAAMDAVDLSRQRRYEVELQIKKLVDQMNDLIDQKRFAEAEVIARQAHDLDPDNPVVMALTESVRNIARIEEMTDLKAVVEEQRYRTLGPDAEKLSMLNVNGENPLIHNDPEAFQRRMQMRDEWRESRNYSSEAERTIWNQLKNSRIQGEFRGSLAETIAQIAAQAGVNIVFDSAALESENITTDRMVDKAITNPISLESVLKVVLGDVNLVFVVEDEVIKITSRTAKNKELIPKSYYVGDLVFPVNIQHSPQQMNFVTPSMQMNTNNQLLSQNGAVGGMGGPVNPLVMAQQIPGMNNPLAGAALGMLDQYRNGGGAQSGTPTYTTTGPSPLGGITLNDFMPLMSLIEQTIATDSWSASGSGDGTMMPFVPNLSLVVSQTQEVQDQIQDLLTRLRELNDVQIVVEVRFITLRDSFFERVGIDFDFQLNDNSGLPPNTQPGDRVPRSAVVGNVGLDGTGFTAPGDLDVGFVQNSFASAVPQFPQFDAGSAANFGFAILSDIEVFFLIQASKGDERTNVAQAPVVTMFNGQSASVFDGAQRPFVTSVVPVVGDFAVAQQPIISLLPEGTALNVQAVASNDRRHVTLSLNPFFSQVTEVKEFTFDGTRRIVRTPNRNLLTDLSSLLDNNPNNDPNEGLEVEQNGVTIQLPVLATTTVSTVVQVPDGGTVLMGGVKRLSEGRTERGVPFLSQIPYINRLFKNVGIGRETSNLMMMVTPRIIIQEEEEDLQVGRLGGN